MNSMFLVTLTKSTKTILLITVSVAFLLVSILILKEIFWRNHKIPKSKSKNTILTRAVDTGSVKDDYSKYNNSVANKPVNRKKSTQVTSVQRNTPSSTSRTGSILRNKKQTKTQVSRTRVLRQDNIIGQKQSLRTNNNKSILRNLDKTNKHK